MMELFHYRAEHLAPGPRERPDGDTMRVRVDLGMLVEYRTRFRLARINCPELSTGEPGRAARDATRSLWPHGTSCLVRTFLDPTDKYGRWIAEVTLPDGRNLSDTLVEMGHAVEKNYG